MLYIRCSEFVAIFANTLVISSLHLSLLIGVYNLIEFFYYFEPNHSSRPLATFACQSFISLCRSRLHWDAMETFSHGGQSRVFSISPSLVWSPARATKPSLLRKKRNAPVSNRQPHPRSKTKWRLRPLDHRRPTEEALTLTFLQLTKKKPANKRVKKVKPNKV